MFWQKRKNQAHPLEYLKLLRWVRPKQDFLEWADCQGASDFKKIWSSLPSCVAIFDDEVSVLDSYAHLTKIFDLLEQKAVEKISSWKNTSKEKPYLILRRMKNGDNSCIIRPFLKYPSSSPLAFIPDIYESLDFSLELFFCKKKQAVEFFKHKREMWLQMLEEPQIDAYLHKHVQDTISRHFKKAHALEHFDSLKNILAHIDGQVFQLAEKKTSLDYLKDVWEIPLFVFAQHPQESALAHLKIKKRFQEIRPHEYTQIAQQYRSHLVKWMLQHPFTVEEKQVIQVLGKPGSKEFFEIIVALYQQIIRKIGVPIEIGELFGPDVFVAKIMKVMDDVGEHNNPLFESLMKSSTSTMLQHIDFFLSKPQEVVQTLLKILRQRLEQFRVLETETNEQLAQALCAR